MIHYHGTPITPREKLLELAGRHFCVSFAAQRDVLTAARRYLLPVPEVA